MSGAGEGSLERIAIAAGPLTEELRAALQRRGWRWCETTADAGAGSLPDPGKNALAWLPARLRLDEVVAADVEEFWREARPSAPRLAVARLVLEVPTVRVPLGAAVVLATPGAAELSGAGLVARRGAARSRLARPWRIELPPSIGAHLRAINAESSVEAAVARSLGARPSWWSLAAAPIVGSLRGWLGAEGARREALTPAILESYRHAASAAKLWELLHAGEATAP